MSCLYLYSEDRVGKLTLTPITWTEGTSTSRLDDTEASIVVESSASATVVPSQASPQALPLSSPSTPRPTHELGSGPGGTPTLPGTPSTPTPDNSLEQTPGSSPPFPLHNTRGSPPDNPHASPLSSPLAAPTSQPSASPPESSPAPIEYNDPILACVQTVQHSLDRLSEDRETFTKTIETLSFSIRRLEKRCEEILAKTRSRDHNDYARTMNSGVRDHTTSLEPLFDLKNEIPLSFPRMAGDIRRLNTAGLNNLFSMYGIPIRGTIAMKKRKFGLFIGLVFDIDYY
ncbi:hypothetical protein HOY80DRAFT_1023876 [Tuber brumale]|nr:hypothetical protein HOY80DRAFT_1023876 [Tuber brumale]